MLSVLKDQRVPSPSEAEVLRELVSSVPGRSPQVIVLKGVRRCGKSILQAQLMRRAGTAFYCNLEDTRLFGLSPQDFPTMLSVIDELAPGRVPVFLDEVQEVGEWERLVRSLLDRGRTVCVTGSNASLLGRELGAKLTGRHLSFGNCSGVGQTGGLPWSLDILQTKREPIPKGLHLSAQQPC